ncbi:putative nuclease HARBI1 [Pomacea canaliculata]|uniref:putative nuclease HARBI1 n=1 Tax=Pomacea canaliculata TaxID=400727 RepID=UPI000D72E86A|nr:putative nuclease HARBI1 [Pomacea canaliculata]
MRARVIESASVWGGGFAIARTLDWSKSDCGESPMLGFCERAMRFHCQLKLWQIDIHSTYGFPNVFGFFDGALIRIQAPTEQEQEFVARKGYHAINVQVFCDADLIFMNCIAKWPGSVHDPCILREK